jgi:hypothetical protein
MYAIDIDAQRREITYPDGIQVLLNGHGFTFPAELPADALDPILSDELDLVGLLGDLVNTRGSADTAELVTLLFRRPTLPKKFLDAVRETYRLLLGDEAFERFKSTRPSLTDYARLTVSLTKLYGVELGKLFGSADSSETDGETSSQTSADSTESTPEGSGSAPAGPGSSDSGA